MKKKILLASVLLHTFSVSSYANRHEDSVNQSLTNIQANAAEFVREQFNKSTTDLLKRIYDYEEERNQLMQISKDGGVSELMSLQRLIDEVKNKEQLSIEEIRSYREKIDSIWMALWENLDLQNQNLINSKRAYEFIDSKVKHIQSYCEVGHNAFDQIAYLDFTQVPEDFSYDLNVVIWGGEESGDSSSYSAPNAGGDKERQKAINAGFWTAAMTKSLTYGYQREAGQSMIKNFFTSYGNSFAMYTGMISLALVAIDYFDGVAKANKEVANWYRANERLAKESLKASDYSEMYRNYCKERTESLKKLFLVFKDQEAYTDEKITSGDMDLLSRVFNDTYKIQELKCKIKLRKSFEENQCAEVGVVSDFKSDVGNPPKENPLCYVNKKEREIYIHDGACSISGDEFQWPASEFVSKHDLILKENVKNSDLLIDLFPRLIRRIVLTGEREIAEIFSGESFLSRLQKEANQMTRNFFVILLEKSNMSKLSKNLDRKLAETKEGARIHKSFQEVFELAFESLIDDMAAIKFEMKLKATKVYLEKTKVFLYYEREDLLAILNQLEKLYAY